MFRIACFIDGGYLDKTLLNEFDQARIDFHKLALWMANGIELLRTYYYHCPPYQSPNPTPEERERFAKAEKFFNNLRRLPRFEVRLGRLEFRGLSDKGIPIFEQKCVDILLGVDLAKLASKGQISHASILTGDSDFLPAIAVAKDEGVLVRLVHGNTVHEKLWEICDERAALNREVIKQLLRE